MTGILRSLGIALFGLFTLELMMVVPASGSDDRSPPKTKNLIDFEDPSGSWRIVNDTVMGGVSRSGMSLTSESTGVFSGELSLENRGGFASVRTFVDGDLSRYEGLEIKVKGDGRVYQVRLRTDREFDGPAYTAHFGTEVGSWATVRLPFATFEATFRGRRVPGGPPLDASRIQQLGFLLADGREGAFRLEVAWVRAYK